MNKEGGDELRGLAERFLAGVERSRRRTFALEDLEAHVRRGLGPEGYVEAGEYRALAEAVRGLVGAGRISPVKARGRNGRRPALYRAYRLVGPKGDRDRGPAGLEGLHPRIDRAGLRRLAGRDLDAVRALSAYLFAHPDPAGRMAVPRNERSLEIFGDEKFLERRPGFLKGLGLDLTDIHAFETREPFFHRQLAPEPRSGLILENLSTFESVCRALALGDRWAWGRRPDLVIYGEGNKILRSVEFAAGFGSLERLAYFGDLDPEGVRILARLRDRDPRVAPCPELYAGLLARRGLARPLPGGQEVDPAVAHRAFQGWGDLAGEALALFREGLWIPQEALGLEALLGKSAQAGHGPGR